MIPFHEKYIAAIHASIAASEAIMTIYQNDFEEIIKSDGSPLTQADLASSDIIDAFLRPLGIPITGEETEKMQFEERATWTECWCVDPLDGTKEFIKKNGEFAVNIALIKDSKAHFGLIASPVRREIIVGSEETGVYIFSFDDAHDFSTWKKLSIPEIFSQKGEIYFRKIEHECLKEVLENSLDVILSLGGGTPCYANNMDLIHQQKAVSIYLRASIATLTDRILKQKASRPLVAFLSDDQVPEFIAKHLFERRFFYEQAQHTIGIDHKNEATIVAEINALL